VTWAGGTLPALPTAGVGGCVLSFLSCHTGTGLGAEAETGFWRLPLHGLPLGLVAQQVCSDVLTQPSWIIDSEAEAQSDKSSPCPHNSSSCVSCLIASLDLWRGRVICGPS